MTSRLIENGVKLTSFLNLKGNPSVVPEQDLLQRKALLEKIDVQANLSSVTAEDIKKYLIDDTGIEQIKTSNKISSLNETLKILREYEFRIGGAEFDQILKENVLIKKHEASIKATVAVSEEDAKEAFVKDNTEYAFQARDYSYLPFADEEVKKAYDANIKDFENPEAVQAQVLSFSAGAFLNEAGNDKAKALELAVAKAEAFLKTLTEKTQSSAAKDNFKDALFQRALKALAKEQNLTLETSNWLTQDNITNADFYLNNKEITEAILALSSDKKTSSIIKSETAAYVSFFSKKGQTKSLAEARPEILEKLYGADVQKFYDENKAGFKTQKQFSATAVQFDSAQFLSQVDETTITDKMIESAYEQQASKYGQKQAKLITISAPFAKESSADKKAALKKEIEAALAEIKKSNGDDYKKNEAKYTEKGLTTTQSTWTNETAIDASYKELVEKTEKGQASEIKEDVDQFVAVYVLDKREKTPIEEATTEIKAEIKNQLATAKAFEAATNLQKTLPNGSDLKALTLKTIALAGDASAKVKCFAKG